MAEGLAAWEPYDNGNGAKKQLGPSVWLFLYANRGWRTVLQIEGVEVRHLLNVHSVGHTRDWQEAAEAWAWTELRRLYRAVNACIVR